MKPPELLAAYRWLTGPDATACLADLTAEDAPLVSITARLRKKWSAEQTHLLLEQAALRRRASDKFSDANRMFFTERGLQQASDQWVASHKASRFSSGSRVVDFCCGMGGDLRALCGRGPVVGVELNPAVAHLAAANCRRVSAGCDVAVTVADAAQWELSATDAWHADPDRRPDGRRTTRIEAHRPGMDVWRRLLSRCPHGAIKLAPATRLPDEWAGNAEAQWISRGGACRQLIAWFGRLAHQAGLRTATVLERDGTHGRTVVQNPGAQPAVAQRLGRFIAEPDPAVLAARLTDTLADAHGLARVAPDIAYLTGDRSVADPALAEFDIAEVLPYDRKRLKQWLRQRRIGRLEVKKRGVPLEPQRVRRELRVAGDNAATLLITRISARTIAILAHRMKPARVPIDSLRS